MKRDARPTGPPGSGADALSQQDRRLLARIDAHTAPPPRTAAQRAAFDAALAMRLRRVRRWRMGLRWASPLAAAASAAALAWVVLPSATGPARVAAPPLSAWERGIVLGDLDALERDASDEGVLPADYAAIDGWLFEGS